MANNPGDFTGRQKAKLQEQHEKEQADRAKEISLITAAEEQRKTDEVVDYTKRSPQAVEDTGPVDLTVTPDDEPDAIISQFTQGDDPVPEPGPVDEPQDVTQQSAPTVTPVEPVQVEKKSVRIRSRYDMDQVTIGKGTLYNFEAGRQYIVPLNVAQHLAELERVDVLG